MANPLFARKPLSLLLEELKGENRLRRVLDPCNSRAWASARSSAPASSSAGSLAGLFSGVLYCLPILAGPIVDRYGFKKSLAACFSIFCAGYFLLGLAGMESGQRIADAVGRGPYVLAVLLLTAAHTVLDTFGSLSGPGRGAAECRREGA